MNEEMRRFMEGDFDDGMLDLSVSCSHCNHVYEVEVESIDDDTLKLKSNPAPGYHPEHHNFVESMGWTFSDKDNVRVDASLHLDGELEVQHSIIKRIE